MKSGDNQDMSGENQEVYIKDEADKNLRTKTQNSLKQEDKSFSQPNPRDESFNVKPIDNVFFPYKLLASYRPKRNTR